MNYSRWVAVLSFKVPFNRATWHQTRYFGNVWPVEMAFDVFESPHVDKNLPPLIIMHGLFGSKQNWRGISRVLASKSHRKIFTVDARNHGDSPHTEEHSSMHMAADLEEFIKSQGFEEAAVMGHSMGGKTMMYAALKYPELIKSGIIVDISPVALPPNFNYMGNILVAMKNIKVSSNLSMARGRKSVGGQIKAVIGEQATVDFIMMNLRKSKTGEFYWTLNVESLYYNLKMFSDFSKQISGFHPFEAPMSFICGKQSSFVDPNDWPEIQEIFPNSELHWLDAGHLVHLDQPADFIELVVNFLAKNE